MLDRVTQEFASVKLGDRRLEERARKTVAALAADPSGSPPGVLTSAELEGYYRFVNNASVTFPALLKAHADATRGRAKGMKRLLVAHDTTDFRFRDEAPRAALGPMDNGGQGFYTHFSLLVGERRPLGILRVEEWTRTTRTPAKKTRKERYESPEKESLRWMRAVTETESGFSDEIALIHVMDREADDYDILCELVEGKHRYVVRASYDRRLVVSEEGNTSPWLKPFARTLQVKCQRDANLSSRRRSRSEKDRKTHPPRDARTATLSFAAQSVTLRRPDKSQAARDQLTLNLIHVWEPEPPEGCEPVEWFLYTSEPIQTEAEILDVVDMYRCRWLIEEFFKALKTGCGYEKRQHETKSALMNALGIFIPIAWSLLCLRTLSRDEVSANRPAQDVFSETQLELIQAESKGRLPPAPTIRDAVLLMARVFGGHLPSNGEPGWQVLGRAFEKLLMREAGWREGWRRAMASLEKSRARSDR